jgi:hypothetical protein
MIRAIGYVESLFLGNGICKIEKKFMLRLRYIRSSVDKQNYLSLEKQKLSIIQLHGNCCNLLLNFYETVKILNLSDTKLL